MHLNYECNLVKVMNQVQILSPKSSEDQKKSSQKIEGFLSPKSSEDKK